MPQVNLIGSYLPLNPKLFPPVAVVIPLYKARDQIGQVLRNIPEWVQIIVVVDDCSPDDSWEQAQLAADGRMHFVKHSQNQGVGGAVLSGYKKAVELGAAIIVKMDADDQMDPAYLPALIEPVALGEADYSKGNRFLHERALRGMPWFRRVGNVGLSFLTKLASGYWNVFDPTNGYTAIRAALVPALDEAAIDRRYFFETSMFLELGLLRAVVRDVYIPARYGFETSSLSERQALVEFPIRLLRGFLRRVWVQHFVRDFGLFSIFLLSGSALFLFGSVFGIYTWILSARLDTTASTGTVMLSVLPIILGVQFLLQAIALDVQSVPTYLVSIDWERLTKLSQADST